MTTVNYIDDAGVGEGAKISAGTVTCNSDGVFKHRTEIGAHTIIGTHTALVAPVSVGDGAMTATGTIVTHDVPAGAMAIGRARMEIKEGLWQRMYAKLKEKKKLSP